MHTFCGGKVSYQALDGMSGAIVIDGIDRHMPEVRTMKERILVLRDAELRQNDLASGGSFELKAFAWASSVCNG
jgi:hypothetical protein